MDLDPYLREVIVCPQCHGQLADGESELLCAVCALAFPVIDNIPVLLIDDARPTD